MARTWRRLIGKAAMIIEPGAGAVKKIARLLKNLEQPAGFVPLDISPEILQSSSARLARDFPEVGITPIVADFMDQQQLQRVFAQLPSQPVH